MVLEVGAVVLAGVGAVLLFGGAVLLFGGVADLADGVVRTSEVVGIAGEEVRDRRRGACGWEIEQLLWLAVAKGDTAGGWGGAGGGRGCCGAGALDDPAHHAELCPISCGAISCGASCTQDIARAISRI